MLIRQILLSFGCGQHKFNAHTWINSPEKRKCFIRDILSRRFVIGMTQSELEAVLGYPCRTFITGIWSYEILQSRFTYHKKKKVINFYFDQQSKVYDIRIKSRLLSRRKDWKL